jgi:hypothetical protein
MWYMQRVIIPVITGATGIVTKSLKKNLKDIPGNHSVVSLQHTAVPGTSHVLLEVLQSETLSLAVGITAGSREIFGGWGDRDKRQQQHNNNNSNNNVANKYSVSVVQEQKTILALKSHFSGNTESWFKITGRFLEKADSSHVPEIKFQ